MIGSRVNAFLLSLAVAISAHAAEPDAAGAPRGLTPQTEPPSTDAPAVTTPRPPAEQALPDKPGAPAGPRVTVSDLGAVDPAGAGLMNPDAGGLAAEMWLGSARHAMSARISQLPSAPSSPAMRSLLKRVLLTEAAPPAGETPPDEPSFLAQRLRKLLASGLIDEVVMLGSQSPRTDAFSRQAWAEALLLHGRDADACGDATSLRQSSNDPYWLKLRVLCYLRANDTQAASLTLNVMHERNIEDAEFFSLADALASGDAAPDLKGLSAPSGIHLAMLRQANKAAPATLASWVPATQLLVQKAADPTLRLTAAERAALAGLISADELRALYDSESFTPDQLDDPEEAAAKLPPVRANALFYQAIAHRTVATARASAFAAALQRAELQNRFALFAALSAGIAQQTKPSLETVWLAPSVTRVLLYTKRDAAAAQWLPVLTSPTDAATLNALQVQLALVRPSVENTARLPAALAWLGQNALKPGGSKDWLMDRATREIPLLAALGYAIPPDAQWAVSANTAGAVPTGVSAEALTAITRSAMERKQGETVLNALVALGPSGPARAQGQTVVRVVKALIDVGLRDDARAIAVETVLASPVRRK